jgi:4-hydroxybenzoate polyprenyltransferase
LMDFPWFYYIGSCGGTSLALHLLVTKVDLGDPKSCAWWFKESFLHVGGGMMSGIVAVHLSKCWEVV